MQLNPIEKSIKSKYRALKKDLTASKRRRWAASEAIAVGFGGISSVNRATGISMPTIRKGISEIKSGDFDPDRDRKKGGGRKALFNSTIKKILEKELTPATLGDPESKQIYCSKSLRFLADAVFKKTGFMHSHVTVGKWLKELGYTLQAPVKSNEGSQHPDRNKQFENISQKIKAAQKAETAVISVDTKKRN